MQIDDFKGKDEPVTEVVEGVTRLKDEHGAREPGTPTRDERCVPAVHLRVSLRRVRHERTDTEEARNWALPNRPVLERVGVFKGDGRMAKLRAGDARMAE